MTKKIKPELAGGFNDYLPEDQKKRSNLIKKIKDTFELFGFSELDTPAVEKKEILTGGDENFDKQIFNLNISNDNSDKIALRFDLTVPLARVISAYPQDIKNPAKLYRFGRVWRGERPQAGRYREFMQCDADIIGADSVLSDAETISLAYTVLKNLDIGDFIIKISNRKILNGLCDIIDAKEISTEILRLIDKLDKISWSGVEEELKDKKLNDNQISKIKEFVSVSENNNKDSLEKMSKILKDSSIGSEGVKELSELVGILDVLKTPEESYKVDFSIARGFGYYTGIIFETVLVDNKELGSILGGGRYDGLIERFSSNKIPAVGFSIGLDRLYEGVKNKIENEKPDSVIVLNFEKKAKEKILKIVSNLRDKNIKTDLYLGKDESLKGQLSYAVSQNKRIVIILGEKELESGEIAIKDLITKEQIKTSFENLENEVLNILNK